MVNFSKRENELLSPIKSELTIPTPQTEIKIDLEGEEAKKLVKGYNLLIKKQLFMVSNSLFKANQVLLNLDPSKENFNEQKLEISKLLVNVISALNGLEVVYVNDKSADNDRGTQESTGTEKKG